MHSSAWNSRSGSPSMDKIQNIKKNRTRRTCPAGPAPPSPSAGPILARYHAGNTQRQVCQLQTVSSEGFTPEDCAQFCAHHQTSNAALDHGGSQTMWREQVYSPDLPDGGVDIHGDNQVPLEMHSS